MEKRREWKDKINRTDWSSGARCVMGREGWREERAWLGGGLWGEVLLGACWEAKEPAGWRLQMAADAWRWDEGGAWPGCMWLEWLLQARQGEVARSEWSQSRGFGEKVDNLRQLCEEEWYCCGGWSAIGARLDGDWNHPQFAQLSTRKHVLVTVCSGWVLIF